MTRGASRAAIAAAFGLAALLCAAGTRAQTAPATQLFLRPVTSMFEHFEEGRFGPVRGVFYDRAHDEVWIADSSNGRIAIFTPDGLPLYTARPGGGLVEPSRLVVLGERTLVLDNDRSRIAVLDWRARYVGPLELPGLPDEPQIGAIATDAKGRLYVGENSRGEVLVYEPDLRLRLRFGRRGDGPGEFQSIAGVAGDEERIVVVDHRAVAVQIFDRRGNLIRGFGEHQVGVQNFSLPSAVAIDSQGRIFVADALRQEVKVFQPDGRFLTRFGGVGGGPGALTFPEDLSLDGADRVYVAEKGNRRVQVFEPVEVPVAAPRGRRARPTRP